MWTYYARPRHGAVVQVSSHAVAAVLADGVGLVILTAGSDEVARIYRRLGFRVVGTGFRADGAVASG